MRFSVLFAVFLSFACSVSGQTIDYVGSGRALQFDGVDDYVDLGNIYDDLTLPVTISVWAYLDNSATGVNAIFASQDNTSLYNGFWFCMSQQNFFVEYGDGAGENNSLYRRSLSSTVSNKRGRWMHLCAVIRGALDMDLYLNGVRVGGNYTGDSNLPMASNYPTDIAKVGAWTSNGGTTHFKGTLDELRIWNRALSETEIRETMCKKLMGTESGLIGYWNFDETSGNTVKDLSSRHYDGILRGNPTRVYSGAAIGDVSTFLYPSSKWATSTSMVSADGLHELVVEHVRGAPEGMQLYRVNALPSQTGGLEMDYIEQPYFGVFSAGSGTGYVFDLEYLYNGRALCGMNTRTDNSGPVWTTVTTTTDIAERFEILRNTVGQEPIAFDLGEEQRVCDQSSVVLSTNLTGTGRSFLWSTGATTPSITVEETGKYWVTVENACELESDTVRVMIDVPLIPFTLGKDEIMCDIKGRVLQATVPPNASIIWQDGSTLPTFPVKEFGSYWMEVRNGCGVIQDTVTFTKLHYTPEFIPNIITPNGDDFNERFIVIPNPEEVPVALQVYNRWGIQVYQAPLYKNDWNGGGLTNGVYFYRLTGACIPERKGTLTIH